MKRKYILTILFLAIAITFCGTVTATEQNATNSEQGNSIVHKSNTINSTQNIIQDNQSSSNPQSVVNDQATNNETTPHTYTSTMSNTSEASPKIVITFDDGYESAYTYAYPVMEQYGIKGTVYINPAYIGQPGFLSTQELIELHNAGWTIANHCWDHPDLRPLTKEQITTVIQRAMVWLNNNGFDDGVYHLAYPYGTYNDLVLQVCGELGIKTARTTHWGTITDSPSDFLQLPCKAIVSDTTRTEWKSFIDESIATDTTTIILLHNIVASNPDKYESINLATFNEFIGYIAQTGIKTLTINQWYNEINNAGPVAAFTATPTSGTAPLTVQFTDQSTGSTNTYAWDFNNDGTIDSNSQNPTYIYSNPGTYTVKLTVTNPIGADDEIKNNYITITYTKPDLVIANLQVPSNPQVGTTYPINFTVTNNGPNNVGSFLVSLKDGTALIGQQTINGLLSGQNTTVTFNWIPTIAGLRSISATADVNNVIIETNETNNNITQQVTVTAAQGLPDLVIANLQVPSTANVGTSYPITVTVTNNGSATAVSSIIYLGENGSLAGEKTVPSLASGQSTTITFNWIPTIAGIMNLQARVDATYLITESDEANNICPAKQITVT